jgi:hypothetical protein
MPYFDGWRDKNHHDKGKRWGWWGRRKKRDNDKDRHHRKWGWWGWR